MFIFDISSPLILVLMIAAALLLIFLAQEIKKSAVTGLTLLGFLGILIFHVVQLITLPSDYSNLTGILSRCIAIDFGFILVLFFAYLWVDDIEAKANNKKSINNSLDWFWKKI